MSIIQVFRSAIYFFPLLLVGNFFMTFPDFVYCLISSSFGTFIRRFRFDFNFAILLILRTRRRVISLVTKCRHIWWWSGKLDFNIVKKLWIRPLPGDRLSLGWCEINILVISWKSLAQFMVENVQPPLFIATVNLFLVCSAVELCA